MFGYVLPVLGELSKQDFILYKSFYCGICKLTGVKYGQMSRFAANYDIAFMSIFLHDILRQDVSFCEEPCISNPFAKRVTVKENPLLDKIAAANIILCYYKAADGVIDRDGFKYRIMKHSFGKPYKKAKSLLPEVDEIIAEGYENLRVAERSGSDNIDKTADCFAAMLQKLFTALCGKNDENAEKLFYNLGKFVYLADALDDIDEDFKKRRYNVFLKSFDNYKNRKQFIEDNFGDLSFCFNTTVNRIIECFNNLQFSQSYSLMQNVVFSGLRTTVRKLLKSDKKLAPPKL